MFWRVFIPSQIGFWTIFDNGPTISIVTFFPIANCQSTLGSTTNPKFGTMFVEFEKACDVLAVGELTFEMGPECIVSITKRDGMLPGL